MKSLVKRSFRWYIIYWYILFKS